MISRGVERGNGAERFFEELKKALLPADVIRPVPAGLRPAGVLVPLRAGEEGVRVVLARRTERVPHHKGQVCFPGGGREPGDRDLLATALRESREEIGIRPENVELLGALEPVPTLTGFFIQPFLAGIPADSRFSTDGFEIEEVFEVPLAVFADFSSYRVADASFRGMPHSVYFLEYGRHTIWGATARILRDLSRIVLRLPRNRFAAG